MSSFPQELIDYIVAQIYDDKFTLSQISVVSHSWSIPARRHLFHSIDVLGTQKEWGFEAFKEFLFSQQHVSTLIRELLLMGHRPNEYYAIIPPLDTILLSAILSKLPCLQILHLSLVRWYTKDHKQGIDTAVHYPPVRLRSLHLQEITFDSKPDAEVTRHFVDLMRLFSTVDVLRYEYVWIDYGARMYAPSINHTELTELDIPQYFRVGSLFCDAGSDWFAIEVIRRSGSLGFLKCAEFQWCDWECLAAIGALIKDLGRCIQGLTLYPTTDFWLTSEFLDHNHRDWNIGGKEATTRDEAIAHDAHSRLVSCSRHLSLHHSPVNPHEDFPCESREWTCGMFQRVRILSRHPQHRIPLSSDCRSPRGGLDTFRGASYCILVGVVLGQVRSYNL